MALVMMTLPLGGALAAAADGETGMPSGGVATFDYGSVDTIWVRPSILTLARRISAPDERSLWKAYPKAARSARLNGAARLSCRVSSDGHLEHCLVAWESQTGFGFGEAALKLAPQFLYEPATRDGVPLTALRVYPVIGFSRYPDSAPIPAIPPQPPNAARPGSYAPAPTELDPIRLPGGPLTLIGRSELGVVVFTARSAQSVEGGVVEGARVEIFAYPTGPATYDIHRVRVNCEERTLAELGSKSFDYRGVTDGWTLTFDDAFRPVKTNDVALRTLESLCNPAGSSAVVEKLETAVEIVRAWPRDWRPFR
ncbi:MAG: TonB family protein [Caulobacterales bacterium]|nr:TonB family protein [Caulobacterales bacterium]